MSQELFDRLRRNSRRKLHVKQEKMSVRLADGSISKKPCKNVWLSVKSHQLARPQRLNFIVMSGSQNLLGRWAMYKLWPRQFIDGCYEGGGAAAVQFKASSVEIAWACPR